jgi:hypothetical protein
VPLNKHPRYRSLYEAVRAGIQLAPDSALLRRFVGASAESGLLDSDALAAAWFAEYCEDRTPAACEPESDASLSAQLQEAYPILRTTAREGCPAVKTTKCPRLDVGSTVEQKVVHLEDYHLLTRGHVASWLQAHSY